MDRKASLDVCDEVVSDCAILLTGLVLNCNSVTRMFGLHPVKLLLESVGEPWNQEGK